MKNNNLFFSQNRRAKWRKREPPRKTGYINTNNSPSTQINGQTTHPATAFATFQQPTTVTPPGGSVESWNSYQSYEITPHYNIISPASSPYGTYTSQYSSPYVHENQIFRHYTDYGSPSRTNGILVDGTSEVHHKNEQHFSIIDDTGNEG